MAKPTSVSSIAMRIIVIVVIVLGVGELVALTNHELQPYFPLWVVRLNALPFYGIWAAVALTYRAGWPEYATAEWRVRLSALATRDRVAIAIAGTLALGMYGDAIATVLTAGRHRAIGLDVISAAVVGPIVEEWVFRGLVWSQIVAAMRGRRGADVVALLASSLAFGLFHTAFEGHTSHALWLAPIHAEFGLLVGVMRWRSKSLAPGLIVHGVGNLFGWLAG